MKLKKNMIFLAIVLGMTVSCIMLSTGSASRSSLSVSSRSINPEAASPTVTITTPLNGQTVNGTINITASASSSAGVNRMELKIDNHSVQNKTTTMILTTLVISYLWNTSTYSDGNHTITAWAREVPGGENTATITVKVQNSTPSDYTILYIILIVGGGVVGSLLLIKAVRGRKVKGEKNKPGKPRNIKDFNPQPEPPGKIKEFNPQPEPPGKPREFNPQPEPPGKPGNYKEFNPQPEPPGKNVKMKKKKKQMNRK
jgi:hypothetical protein